MSRTLNGNLTGKAAHGIDDIYEAQSDYSKRLDIAKSKVKSIFSDDAFFIHWMMRIEQGKMLETMETVIAQVTHYDNGVDLVDVGNWKDEPISAPKPRIIVSQSWLDKHTNNGIDDLKPTFGQIDIIGGTRNK